MRVDNQGSAAADGLVLTIRVPRGVAVESVPDDCGPGEGGSHYRCTYPRLAVEAVIRMRLAVSATSAVQQGPAEPRRITATLTDGADRDASANESTYRVR